MQGFRLTQLERIEIIPLPFFQVLKETSQIELVHREANRSMRTRLVDFFMAMRFAPQPV
jgi:hypothetical protein